MSNLDSFLSGLLPIALIAVSIVAGLLCFKFAFHELNRRKEHSDDAGAVEGALQRHDIDLLDKERF